MIANVIRLYYFPFEIFQRAFPFFVIFVIFCNVQVRIPGHLGERALDRDD